MAAAERLAAIERASAFLARFLLVIAQVLLLAILALTVVDVVGRYLLNAPVNGKTELTRMMMAAMIAVTLPIVTAAQQHITVDLLDGLFGPRAALVRDTAVNLLCGLAALVLAWWVVFRAERLLRWGYVSDFLHVPLYPIAYFIAAMVAFAGLAALLRIPFDVLAFAARGGAAARSGGGASGA